MLEIKQECTDKLFRDGADRHLCLGCKGSSLVEVGETPDTLADEFTISENGERPAWSSIVKGDYIQDILYGAAI